MILTIEDITKSYGEKTLFSHVSLNIDEGDKIGIVGVNGTGKSTFLRTVAGRLSIDSGSFVPMRGLRISFLEQEKEFVPENTVLMEVFRGGSPLMEALRSYELALQAVESRPADERAQQELMRLTARIDELGGWQVESDAKTILSNTPASYLQNAEEPRYMSQLTHNIAGGSNATTSDETSNATGMRDYVDRVVGRAGYLGDSVTSALVTGFMDTDRLVCEMLEPLFLQFWDDQPL